MIIAKGKPQEVVDQIKHMVEVYGKNARVVDVIKGKRS